MYTHTLPPPHTHTHKTHTHTPQAALHHAQHGPPFNPETDGEWPVAFEIEDRGAVEEGEWGGRVCVGQVVCGSKVLGGVWWDGGGRLEGARAEGEEGRGREEGNTSSSTSSSETVLDLCDAEGRPLARLLRHSSCAQPLPHPLSHPLPHPLSHLTSQHTAHAAHSHGPDGGSSGGSSSSSGGSSSSSSSSSGSGGSGDSEEGWVQFLKLQPPDAGGNTGQRWEEVARLVMAGSGSGSGSSAGAGARRGVLLDPRLPPPLQETHRLIRQAAPGVRRSPSLLPLFSLSSPSLLPLFFLSSPSLSYFFFSVSLSLLSLLSIFQFMCLFISLSA